MTIVKLPSVTSSLLPASVKAAIGAQKVLFVGQMTSAGTAVSGALNENIGNDNAWDTLFGLDSMLAAMIRAGRAVNGATQFDAIALDDAAGTPATGTITFTGPATEAGTLNVYVGSKKNHAYSIAVADTDTETVIAAAVAAAITADTKCPADAIAALGVVTLTAVHDGTFGNTLGVAVEGTVGGVTSTVVAMVSGATDPTLTGVFDVVGTNRYQAIVWPYDTDLDTLTDFLDPRFNVDNDILDGVGFVSMTDTLANHLTALAAENSESLCINADKLEIATAAYKGPALLEIPVVKAAQFASIRSLRLTEDASIGSFVITRSARDSFGGAALASKPYFNTPHPDLELINTGMGWTDTEIKQLKDVGGWVLGNNRAGNEVISGEVVTTYKTDAAGNPDPTFTFLNYVDTTSAIREYFVNNYRSRYSQFRLTAGALIRGRDSANENSLAAFAAELNSDLGSPDFALTQTGTGTIDGVQVDFDKLFRDNVVVTIDLVNGKAIIALVVYVIVQLRIIQIPIQIAFSPEG
jgi:phage tail sheath gpL-like